MIVNKVLCFAGKKNGVKYLKIDKGMGTLSDSVLNTWNQVFAGIKYHIEKISDKKVNYDSEFDKVKFITNDSFFTFV